MDMYTFSIRLFFLSILVCSFLNGIASSVPAAQRIKKIADNNMFKFELIELLRKREKILTEEHCKSEIVGNFFCYEEVDANTARKDSNCIKAFDADNRFRYIKRYIIVEVNNKSTPQYCKELEALPIANAISKVQNENLMLTCEAYQSKEIENPIRVKYLKQF